MKFPYNSPLMVDRRRQLRAQSSKPEDILWNQIKNNKLGFKFRRQYSIQSYVLDFFCSEKRVNIEIDGKHHIKSQEYDRYRDRYLNALDITVLRFPAQKIFHNLDNVIKEVEKAISLS